MFLIRNFSKKISRNNCKKISSCGKSVKYRDFRRIFAVVLYIALICMFGKMWGLGMSLVAVDDVWKL